MEIQLRRLSVILTIMIVTYDALMPISRCLYAVDVNAFCKKKTNMDK